MLTPSQKTTLFFNFASKFQNTCRILQLFSHEPVFYGNSITKIRKLHTLVSLIAVLSWISILEGILPKINKRPALNRRPGRKNHKSTIFHLLVSTKFSFFWFQKWYSIANIIEIISLISKSKKKCALINILQRKCSKINKRPVFNKGVLGRKILKNNKNVLDCY